MYRKIIINCFAIVIPVLLLVSVTNYKNDSAFVFNKRSDEIAKIVVDGRNAAIKYVPAYWGDLQASVITERKKRGKLAPMDILVFGTSRSSEINSLIFEGHTFFNCPVPGGNVLDYIGLYGLYKSNALLPKYLIINIDPWTFHGKKIVKLNKKEEKVADSLMPLVVSRDLEESFNYAAESLGINYRPKTHSNSEFSYIEFFENLFSLSYFQLNSDAIFSDVIYPTEKEDEISYFVIRKDGGYSLAIQSNIDSLKVKKRTKDYIEVHKDRFFLASDTTNVYFDYLKKLLLCLKNDGVVPIVYFSPINPLAYENLAPPEVVPIELVINKFCKNEDIKVVGSFNPHLYGYHSIGNNYMDAVHPVKSLVNNIFYQHRTDLQEIGIKVSKQRD